LKDSGGSDNEDFQASDDEFTSMFRSVGAASRTTSFTALAGHAGDTGSQIGGGGVGNTSSRRSTTAASARGSSATSPRVPTSSSGGERSGAADSTTARNSNTIVQPFINQFHLPSASAGPSSGRGAVSSARGSIGPGAGGRRGSGLLPAAAVTNNNHHKADEDESDGSDADDDEEQDDGSRRAVTTRGGARLREGSPPAVRNPLTSSGGGGGGDGTGGDVLTEVVRREWKPISLLGMGEVGSPNLAVRAGAGGGGGGGTNGGGSGGDGHGHHHGARSSGHHAFEPVAAAQLMEEWDMQSMQIEKQQQNQSSKAASKPKIGAL